MLHNKKVLVAGLGSTGVSVLAYCAHVGVQAAGYDAHLSDNQKADLTKKFPQFPLFSGSLKTVLVDYDVLVLSPGMTRRQPEIREFEERGGKVIGDVAILADLLKNQSDKIIAITGSNGKPLPPVWWAICVNKAVWTRLWRAILVCLCWKRGWHVVENRPMFGCWSYLVFNWKQQIILMQTQRLA